MSNKVVGDEFHTMNELYEHRTKLFAIICNIYKEMSWKSKKHEDGTMFKDYFIVGVETRGGSYTYHCEIKFWDIFDVKELDNAPEWDGHLPKDIDRLFTLPDRDIMKWKI